MWAGGGRGRAVSSIAEDAEASTSQPCPLSGACEIRAVQLVLRGLTEPAVPATLTLTFHTEGESSKLSIKGKRLKAGEAATLVLHREWDNAVTFMAATNVEFKGGRVKFGITSNGAAVVEGFAGVEGLCMSRPGMTPRPSTSGSAPQTLASGKPQPCAELSLLGSFAGNGVSALVARCPVTPGAFNQRRLSFCCLDVILEEKNETRSVQLDGGADGADWYAGGGRQVPSEAPTRDRDESHDDGSPEKKKPERRRVPRSRRNSREEDPESYVGALLRNVTPHRWGGDLEDNAAWLLGAAANAGAAATFGAAMGMALSATLLLHGVSTSKRLLPRAAWRGQNGHRDDGGGSGSDSGGSSPRNRGGSAGVRPNATSGGIEAPWALALAQTRLVELAKQAAARGNRTLSESGALGQSTSAVLEDALAFFGAR